MLQDWTRALTLLLLIICLVNGTRALCPPMRRVPWPVAAALIALVLGFSVTLGWLFPALIILQCVVGFLQIWGAGHLIRMLLVGRARRPSTERWVRWGTWGLTGLAPLAYWIWVLNDLDGVGALHDGIVHTLYFTRILESGELLSHRIPVSLTEFFGPGWLGPYPSGTHALMAIVSGAWTQWLGWLPADTTKAWLLLVTASAPWAAMWFAGQIWRRQDSPPSARTQSLLLLAVGLLAITYFRYPIELIAQGGLSRQIAVLCILPLIAWLLTARVGDTVIAGLWLFSPLAVFILHPSVCVLWTATLGWKSLYTARKPRVALAAAIGLGAVAAWVWGSESQQAFVAHVRNIEQSPWAAQLAIVARAATLTWDDPNFAAARPISSRQLLWILALVALIKGGTGLRTLRTYPVWLFGVFSLVLLTAAFPAERLRLVAQLVYNHPVRTAEMLYPIALVLWAVGLWALWRGRNSWLGRGVAALWLVLLVADTVRGLKSAQGAVRGGLAATHSPSRQRQGNVIDAIKALTPQSAWIVVQPYRLDSIELRTGRKVLFIYGECPYGSRGPNCQNRKQWAKALRTNPCTIPRPALGTASTLPAIYWLVKSSDPMPPNNCLHSPIWENGKWRLWELSKGPLAFDDQQDKTQK